jgi:hypothetical protein
MEETSSGQHMLMKDQSRIKKALRHTTIVVNSRDRNFLNYPNPNHFRYTLRRPLTNVMSIELMNGSVPAFIYNIQPAWGSFNFYESYVPSVSPAFTTRVTLTPGFYTDTQLATELQTQLNNIPARSNTYTVIQDPITRKITIGSDSVVQFKLLFYSGDVKDELDLNTLAVMSINTPARLLGFGFNDYISSSGSITAPLPMDLSNFLTRLYLHIETDGKNLDRMEQGAGRRDCFHIFYMVPGAAEYLLLDKETDHSIYTSSPAPIARVSNLEINIFDEFNRPVDLNHREVNLVFEITHLE